MKLVPDTWINQYGTGLAEPSTNRDNSDQVEFPSNIKQRADQLWSSVKKSVHLNGEQQVVYDDDDVTGSHVVDLMEYFLLPRSKQRPRPYDSDKFLALIPNPDAARLLDKRFARYLPSINTTSRTKKSISTNHSDWVAF